MHSSEKKSILLLLIVLLLSVFNIFINKIFYVSSINYLIFWVVLVVLSIKILGYQKDKGLNKIDVIQVVIIYSLAYLFLSYLGGLYFGFTSSVYNLEFLKILKNITPLFLTIIMEEVFRYVIISKTGNKYITILLIISLIILNLSLVVSNYDLKNPLDIFQFIGDSVIPIITTNILITYITKKCSFIPGIIYRSIFELYIYIVPIFPDYGLYFNSIFNCLFPAILFMRLNTLLSKSISREKNIKKFKSILTSLPILCLLVMTVSLVSGVFNYYLMAIGSNSMVPIFSKGDAVIINKIDKNNYENLVVGDILVFKKNGRTIVHRIAKITKNNNKYMITTKGDNNDAKDDWIVENNEIVGKVTFVVPYIGYPSIWLEERFND